MSTFALQQVQTIGVEQAGALLGTAPTLVLQPLNYTVNNLRPFDVQVYVFSCSRSVIVVDRYNRAEAVDFVGLIYLLILSVSSDSLIKAQILTTCPFPWRYVYSSLLR